MAQRVAAYDARLTAAGFLGDIEVTPLDGGIALRGLRAPIVWIRGRIIAQWSLAALGIGGMIAGFDWAFSLIIAAVAFSFAAYLCLWWVSSSATVSVTAGPQTRASTGWVFRWYDIFWLGNFITAIVLLITASSAGRSTVTFDGPAQVPGSTVRYHLVARNPGEAAVLTARLLGLTVDPAASV